MSSVQIEKSYLPQYIQFECTPTEKLYPTLDNSIRPEIIIYPNSNENPSETYQGSQQLYPGLLPSNKNSNSKTPLIPKPKKHAPSKVNWLGIFLAFMSGVFFTLCSSTVKYLTDIDPMELLIFRSLFQVSIKKKHILSYCTAKLVKLFHFCVSFFTFPFQVALTLPIALIKGHNVFGPEGSRVLLFLQGLVGGTTLVMLFYSFRLLPLGDAATIIFR